MTETMTNEPIDPRLAELVRTFRQANGEARAQALAEIQSRGQAGIEGLLNLLKLEETQRSIRYRLAGLGVIGAVVCIAVFGNMAGREPSYIPFVFLAVFGWLLMLSLVARSLLPSKQEQGIKAVLSCLYETLEDTRAVGPLLEVCGEYLDPNLSRWNALALTKLLPQFTPTQYKLMTPKQRNQFNKLLSNFADEQKRAEWHSLPAHQCGLIAAMLEAAGRVGDKDSVAGVRKLVDADTPTPAHAAIPETAQTALIQLEERLRLKNE